jgi:hypothetical protein
VRFNGKGSCHESCSALDLMSVEYVGYVESLTDLGNVSYKERYIGTHSVLQYNNQNSSTSSPSELYIRTLMLTIG